MKIRTLRGAGFAAGATLLSHWVSYRLTLADPTARQHLLEETGHSWLGWSWPIAIVALSVAVVGMVRNRRVDPDRPTSSVTDALALYLAGAGSFLGVEIIERWHHLGDLDAVATNLLTRNGGLPVLLGILLIALISPLFLAVERIVHHALAGAADTHRTRTAATYPTRDFIYIDLHHLDAGRTRGPPMLAGSGLPGQH